MKKLLIVILICVFSQICFSKDYCQIWVKTEPSFGGNVTPSVGVHDAELGQWLRLQATPKSGFKFSHWLGSVQSSESKNTSIFMDGTKIVYAIFERTDYSSTVGGSGGIPPVITIDKIYHYYDPVMFRHYHYLRHKQEARPTPVPEPITMAFLGIGGLLIITNRGKTKDVQIFFKNK